MPTCPIFTRAKLKSHLGDFKEFAVTLDYYDFCNKLILNNAGFTFMKNNLGKKYFAFFLNNYYYLFYDPLITVCKLLIINN